MGHLCEPLETFTPRIFQRARPGPVRRLTAKSARGRLVLEWKPAVGADFYRIERTREGRNYEWLAETRIPWHCHHETVRRDPWFYRVTAVNRRGVGRATLVWFFERRGNAPDCLIPVPVRPGVRVDIYEPA